MKTPKLFRDRADAGRQLAAHLHRYRSASPLVLGLPRGGVPVAYEVARALDAPLDVCVVRKIGAPSQPELGIGAVAEDGSLWIDRSSKRLVGMSDDELESAITKKSAEVEARVRMFRHGKPPLDVRGRTVIVVDDGIATGGTARAALHTLRSRGARRIVLAVPVGASDTVDVLASEADETICLYIPERFIAVGLWYDDFRPTTDEDVVELLDRRRRESGRVTSARGAGKSVFFCDSDVRIPVGDAQIEGHLTIPLGAHGLVLFAHGSGSSRLSPRNQYVANVLLQHGLATLLFDLLTAAEEAVDIKTRRLRFDIELLASRLIVGAEWARGRPGLAAMPLGYFGASTGAAAALVAAAARPDLVSAVVSRGGRPDLASASLVDVEAPTLLLVGGDDTDVLQLNREALSFLRCHKRLEVIPGASHLFEEPGSLEEVARAAAGWFSQHLRGHFIDQAAPPSSTHAPASRH